MRTTSRGHGSKCSGPGRRRTKASTGNIALSILEDINSKCNSADLEWTDKIPDCPVYHPSIEEFEEPLNFIKKISVEASNYGICKIVSPLEASVPAAEVLKDLEFSTYIQRLAKTEKVNDRVKFSFGNRKYTYQTFKHMADEVFSQRFPNAACSLSPAQLEKQFWNKMANRGKQETVEYATNVDGTAFSSDPSDHLGASKWNLKSLPRLPNSLLRLVEHEIPGITHPMLYIGMLFSMFAWHVEDHYLYSINYHHAGAPKTWYGVPGHAAQQFERVCLQRMYPNKTSISDWEDSVFKEIAEKTTMLPPSVMLQHGVPVCKTVQMPGEFVITFPKAYHAGFSNGFNCGEAVNFAIHDWFPFGAEARKRYAMLQMNPIIPHEEILCREAHCVSKNWDLEEQSLSGELGDSMKITFVQHMHSLNDALRRLKNNVGDLEPSKKLLPDSHGTTICSTCKRDCYLTFLECNCCYILLCLHHDIKSLVCSCGGKRILHAREDLLQTKQIAEKLQDKVSLRLLDGGDTVPSLASRGTGDGDFDGRSCRKVKGVLSSNGKASKRARLGSCRVQRRETKITKFETMNNTLLDS
ncbi:hypothetical protein Tsubulata_047053 [Turnera subulata]|uniref:JmjC domain-containing protein n=1 Tax=Turnera subulata TaxID=218843 RepID=A0A9Q0G9L4_9ROSI|nr:hypothetical protein Tsubulata_047053 [Turnera subulata]